MKKNHDIALGGILIGLGVVILFLAGIFPTLSYTLAALAGCTVLVAVLEMGLGRAMMVYAGVSILSLLLVAQKDAAVLFVLLFGLYPVLKSIFETRFGRRMETTLKFAYFNIAIVAAFYSFIYVLGIPNDMGPGLTAGLWGVLNIMFLPYDRLLTIAVTMYNLRIKGRR